MFAAHGIQTATQQEISEKQRLVWDAYDNIPEVHFLGNGVIGASVETLSFYPAMDDVSSAFNYAQPIEESDEYEQGDLDLIHSLVAGIKPPWGQQSDFMRALAINLFFPAEVYHAATYERGKDVYTHQLVPKQNIILPKKAANNKVIESYKDPISGQNVKVGDSGTLQRIWRPHPANPNNADSPMFAVLEVLDEMKWIQRLISSMLKKRVYVSKMLIMTNSILGPDFDPQSQTSLAGAVNKVEKSLIDQMNRNIQSDSDSAVLPMLGFVPFEHVKDGFNLIDVAGDLPEMLLQVLEAAQRRLANGVDVPAEFLLGMGGSSHWSAYLIRDLLWQQHIFPLAGLIASSLTSVFLRPALRRAQDGGRFKGDPEKVKLWFRSNQLQTHPEIFTYLVTAYDKGIIGKGPILAALGIPPEAAITDAELKLWIQLKLAGMGTTDEVGEGSSIDVENGTVVLPNGVFPSPSRTRSGGTVSGDGPADRSRAGEDGPSQR